MATAEFSKFAGIFSAALSQYRLSGFEIQIYLKWQIDGETVADFIFLDFSCFFYDPTDIGNLISGSSAFSKSSLNSWKFSVHILLKPSLNDFEHDLASM